MNIFKALGKILLARTKRYFSFQLRIFTPLALAFSSFSNQFTRQNPVNIVQKALTPSRSIIGSRLRRGTDDLRRFLRTKKQLTEKALIELGKIEGRLPAQQRNEIRQRLQGEYKRINKFFGEIKQNYLYTTFIKAPYSWLQTMFFKKNQNSASVTTKKGGSFNLVMNDSVFEAMSKSTSPGRVLWNTLWLHKRRNYLTKGTRISAKILFKNKRISDFNLKYGIRKYQQINRKW